MPALTKTDMFELVTRLNETYQPCAKRNQDGVCVTPGPCVATPRRMKFLLDELQVYTDEVQWARNKYRALGVAAIALGPAGIAVSELLGGGDVDVAQWRQDMTNWQFRLADYNRMLTQYIAEHPTELDTVAGCEAIYRDITSPLLDGVWYRIMPGIIYSDAEKESIRGGGPSDRSVNDVITPWTLGNQILTYQDFQRENAIKFFEDLIEAFRKAGSPDEWPPWLKGAIIVGVGVAVGLVGLYVYQFLPKPPPRASNGRSRRRPQRVIHTSQTKGGRWRAELREGDRTVIGFGATEDDAITEADQRAGNPRKRKELGDPRRFYSDSTLLDWHATLPEYRRGSIHEGTAEKLWIGEDRKESWKPLPKKGSR